MPKEGPERGGSGDPAGGNGPQAGLGEMRPRQQDGGSGGRDGAPAGTVLPAEQAVVRLEQPNARAVKQVAEKRLGFVIAVGLGDAGVGFRGVASLRAADSPDDPTNRGGSSVVAPPIEGQAEEAGLMQQSNGELASRGGAENSLTDGQVGRRVGSTLSELVPCESDGRAPVEQVLASELTAEAQRAVAKVALLPVDGREVMGPGPGTLRSESREAAFTEVWHGGGDEGPAVAAGTAAGTQVVHQETPGCR